MTGSNQHSVHDARTIASRQPLKDALAEAERELVHKDMEIRRLEEQYQAARDLLIDAHDLIWNHDAPYVEGGPKALDALAQKIEAYLESNPATSSEADGRRLVSDLPDASDPAKERP